MENKFSFELAKAGKPVCTRDGRKAKIICFDARLDHREQPIIALVEEASGYQRCLSYCEDGRFYSDCTDPQDLVMDPSGEERYVNVYSLDSGEEYCGNFIYKSLEDARNNIFSALGNYVRTVKLVDL